LSSTLSTPELEKKTRQYKIAHTRIKIKRTFAPAPKRGLKLRLRDGLVEDDERASRRYTVTDRTRARAATARSNGT
jgi:hypothetical protein